MIKHFKKALENKETLDQAIPVIEKILEYFEVNLGLQEETNHKGIILTQDYYTNELGTVAVKRLYQDCKQLPGMKESSLHPLQGACSYAVYDLKNNEALDIGSVPDFDNYQRTLWVESFTIKDEDISNIRKTFDIE